MGSAGSGVRCPEPSSSSLRRAPLIVKPSFVRARRRAAGLTQRQLAELVGVGVRLVSELENDKPTLRMDVVNRVLAAFGKRLGCVEVGRFEVGGDASGGAP